MSKYNLEQAIAVEWGLDTPVDDEVMNPDYIQNLIN